MESTRRIGKPNQLLTEPIFMDNATLIGRPKMFHRTLTSSESQEQAPAARLETVTQNLNASAQRPGQHYSHTVSSRREGIGPVVIYPAKTVLFPQGSRPQHIFFILSGTVKLVHSINGLGATAIGLRLSGSLIGATAALTSTKHSVGAETVSSTHAHHFDVQEFRELIDRDLRFSSFVSRVLCREVTEGVQQLTGLLSFTAKSRLQFLLLELARGQQKGPECAGPTKVALPIRLRDVADLIGITPEHLSRLLTQLEHEGLFRRSKGWFIF